MINKILQIIQYYKFPKYYINKGVSINRTYFSLLKHAKQHPEFSWAYSVIKCYNDGWKRNDDYGYDKSNVYMRIWTFKGLIKARRNFKHKSCSETMNSNFTQLKDK